MANKPTPPAAPAAAQPYYLQRAHIKDFLSIRDAKVDFKPGLNIIIGANGSGKTNFVRCVQNNLSEVGREFIGKSDLTLDGKSKLRVRTFKINTEDEVFRAAGMSPNINKQDIVISANRKVFRADSFPDAQYNLIKSIKAKGNTVSSARLLILRHGVPLHYSIVRQPVNFNASPTGGSYSIHNGSLFADLVLSQRSWPTK